MDIMNLTSPESLIAYGVGCASGYGFSLASIVPLMKQRIEEYAKVIEELSQRVFLLEKEIKDELRKQLD